jgi:hypothetical protein
VYVLKLRGTRTLKDNDILLPGSVTGKLNGIFNGLSTAVDKEKRVQGLGRHQWKQPLNKLHHWYVKSHVYLQEKGKMHAP